MPDSNGELPLHRAVSENAPAAVIAAILGANPAAIAHCSEAGLLPLSCIGPQTPTGVVRLLFEAAGSNAALTRNGNGRVPLHSAVAGGVARPVMEAMLLAAPGARAVRGSDGSLPIHCVCSQTPDWAEALALLLKSAVRYFSCLYAHVESSSIITCSAAV